MIQREKEYSGKEKKGAIVWLLEKRKKGFALGSEGERRRSRMKEC